MSSSIAHPDSQNYERQAIRSMLLTESVENCEFIQEKKKKEEEPCPQEVRGLSKGDQHLPRNR